MPATLQQVLAHLTRDPNDPDCGFISAEDIRAAFTDMWMALSVAPVPTNLGGHVITTSTPNAQPSGTGHEGDIFINTADGQSWAYDGSTWVYLGGSTGKPGPRGPRGPQGSRILVYGQDGPLVPNTEIGTIPGKFEPVELIGLAASAQFTNWYLANEPWQVDDVLLAMTSSLPPSLSGDGALILQLT